MANSIQFQSKISFDTSATIANGATDSSVIDLHGATLVGITLPAALDSAAITIEASDSGSGAFLPVFDASGEALSLTVAANQMVTIEPARTSALRFIKLVTASAESAERSIQLITRAV